MKKTGNTAKLKDFAILAGMVVAAYFLWDTPVIYPVKLFVVILHEMSHGMAALLCGGRIHQIQIDYRIGGYCEFSIPAGFFRNIFVASAGYIGSMLWGALILIVAARTRYDKVITFIISLVVLILALLFVREPFGIAFCLIFSGLLAASCRFLPDWFNDYLLKFLGMTSCLYAVVDIKEDLIERTGIGSDADQIAKALGIPGTSIVIGIIWIVLAVIILGFAFRIAGDSPARSKNM